MSRKWLRELRYSDIYRWVDDAQAVFRELPFVYQTDKRVIHGIVDLLMQRADGTWVIVDYKSSKVDGFFERVDDKAERENMRLLAEHAKRYHLQLGVYAAAVERYLSMRGLDIAPEDIELHIYYLRYRHAVQVPSPAWIQALNQLESQIGKLIDDEDDYDEDDPT
ncbi:MAG: PD-(D/E)XK nuclease family protein, partial [Chloroflexota bacterium]